MILLQMCPTTLKARWDDRSETLKTICILIGNESVLIQLPQCRFPELAISHAKILIYFSNRIYGSNFIKQHTETVMD